MSTATPTCDLCGAHAPEDPAGTTDLDHRGGGAAARVYCPTCSREHLRTIEGKLDSEWW